MKLRISQIVAADGQGWIALIDRTAIVGRFTNWADARSAHRTAKAAINYPL